IVHALSPDAEYQDTDARPTVVEHPVAAFAPALILRKRARKGFVEIFRTIIDQLSSGQPVPAGVLPLVDPEHVPVVDSEPGDGAVVMVDEDLFLPMPVNDRQLQILRRVDTHAQTLVQGPPGTGKTHTAAALISHLLAQGKRVLVTAHTDRALKEVRAKLPAAIRPLAVSVVGSTREDMSDLRVAVERIGAMAAEHDAAEALARVDRTLRSIDDLRVRRAAAFHDLLTAREDEVQMHEFAGYRGTLASIARELATDAERNRWLSDYVDDVLHAAPLHSQEIVEWHALLTDPALAADEIDAQCRVFEPAGCPIHTGSPTWWLARPPLPRRTAVCSTSGPIPQPPPCTGSLSTPETRFKRACTRSSPSSTTYRAVASPGWQPRSTTRAVAAPTCGALGAATSSS
ncbi:MAG: AAA domain-containing protein, partial [Pseudonocardiaceae bacterium]